MPLISLETLMTPRKEGGAGLFNMRKTKEKIRKKLKTNIQNHTFLSTLAKIRANIGSRPHNVGMRLFSENVHTLTLQHQGKLDPFWREVEIVSPTHHDRVAAKWHLNSDPMEKPFTKYTLNMQQPSSNMPLSPYPFQIDDMSILFSYIVRVTYKGIVIGIKYLIHNGDLLKID